MQSRIKERCKKFLDGITLQLQQEKEDMIQEGRQKILEEIELQLEDIHVKYDGIISKAISIKIKHRGYKVAFYLIKKKLMIWACRMEGNHQMKPYRHLCYQESLHQI